MAATASPVSARDRKILDLRARGQSQREVASAIPCSKSTVFEVLRLHGDPFGGKLHGGTPPGAQSAPRPEEEAGTVWDEKGDEVHFKGVSENPIRSEEDAVREFKIDLARWRVERMQVKAWTVGMKVGDKERGFVPHREQQYGVTLWLKRRLPKRVQDAHDAIFERMAKYAPRYDGLPRLPKNRSGETFLGVLSLVDAHAGKLCWAPETGNDYDLKVFEAVYRNAVDDLIAEVGGRPVSQWLLPVGSDFYHVDNARNTTFNGTPQDVDGRYAKVIEAGEMAVIWAVERLMQTAPVSVVWVPGNHDPTTSFHLARTLQAWFRRCDRVTVDAGPNPRKYFAWGCNLLGLTHGNEEKPATLPSLMATERPKEWAASTCREWLIGHMHRSRQWQTQGVDTFEGTTVRVLKSLAGTDSWHHRKGYIGNTLSKAAELFIYGKTRGLAGYAVVPARGG
jgi:hypothetical protein